MVADVEAAIVLDVDVRIFGSPACATGLDYLTARLISIVLLPAGCRGSVG